MSRSAGVSAQHTRRRIRRALAALLIAGVVALAGASTAHAALTTGACLASKRKAWAGLRKCLAVAQTKQLLGKSTDPSKCYAKSQARFAAIVEKAAAAMLPCRYGDNGDGTLTDYDTGLQWEKKAGDTNSQCSGQLQCVGTAYSWLDAETFVSELNGATDDGSSYPGPFGGYACLAGTCDWRLPTLVELRTIIDLTVPGCASGPFGLCIDPSFGATVSSIYWSVTPLASNPDSAWSVNFYNGDSNAHLKTNQASSSAGCGPRCDAVADQSVLRYTEPESQLAAATSCRFEAWASASVYHHCHAVA